MIFFVGALLCGCTTTRHLKSPLDANHAPITDEASIFLRTGEVIDATNIEVGTETTKYILSGGSVFNMIPTSAIDKLRVTDHLAGGVGGFLGGGVGGFFAGILVGKMTGISDTGNSDLRLLVYAAGGLAIGSVGGSIYGANRGYQRNYIFPHDSLKALNE
jgi:hypothetical protein